VGVCVCDGVFVQPGQEKIPPYQALCRYYVSIKPSVAEHNNMYDITFGGGNVLDGSVHVKEIRDQWSQTESKGNQTKPTWNFGPFLNDAFNSGLKNNCRIEGTLYWDPVVKTHFLVLYSTKTFTGGEELFWSYGKKYWDDQTINKSESA
jgi:hypothetical protein